LLGVSEVMNVSDKVGYIWWASPRCGSRAVSEIFKHYDFYNYELDSKFSDKSNIRYVAHTHSYDVPADKTSYPIIMQIRNPYSRAVSSWHLSCFKEQKGELKVLCDFEQFVLKNPEGIMDHYENSIEKFKPKHFIRYENLQEDIKKIPFVEIDSPFVQMDFISNILNNQYKYEGVDDPRGDLRRTGNYADWKTYYMYNSRLADLVYDAYKHQFEKLGYEKNSWKR